MNDIVERAREEAALCRAETADDIAALLDALADEIERLRAELAAAKRDAERYRWLRDKAGNSIMRRLMDSAIPPEWDDMIDEAMKGEE